MAFKASFEHWTKFVLRVTLHILERYTLPSISSFFARGAVILFVSPLRFVGIAHFGGEVDELLAFAIFVSIVDGLVRSFV